MTTSASQHHSIYLQRNPLGIGAEYIQIASGLASAPSESVGAQRSVQNGILTTSDQLMPVSAYDGATYTNHTVNDVVEAEIPYYSAFRFTPGKVESLTGVETFDPTWRYNVTTFVSTTKNLDLWVSTAEDFQVYMWTGLPRMYYESAVPAAA
jgi:hypothetical protein